MIKKLDTLIELFAKWGLVVCVTFMLGLTLMNIVMRWFEFSLHWVDPAVRHLVFISAFLGGTLATGSRHHIKVDLLARILEKKKSKKMEFAVDIIVTLISMLATVVLAYASYNLAVIEFEFGKKVFLGIHSGFLLSIIPVGMGLMAFRFLLRFLLSFSQKTSSVKNEEC